MENHENIRLPWQDWRIVKYLGGGTYGKVYEIERNISGIQEKAAVKIISRPKDTSEIESYYDNGYDKASIVASYEKEIQNYVQEYKLMKELQGQSNIVSCDDFTVVPHTNGIGGDIFIRMELLTSLQQVLRERTLSMEEIIKLGKDISRALILCEKKHIVHRDIKPNNIMISPFEDYKLGDFGVSKVMDHQTYATTTGTPDYLAPEVIHMEKYGQTADIYSLGITLYWLLNNRKMPFIDADESLTPMRKTEATERRYRGEKLPPPKYGSSQLKQIVLKACEYRPENRYSSARELYAALDALKNENTTINHQRQENDTAFSQGYSEPSTTYGQDETASWGNTVGTVGNPGGKAQPKKARVFTSEEIKANADHWGDKFENVFGNVFGNTGDDVDSTIGINNAGKKRNGMNQQNNASPHRKETEKKVLENTLKILEKIPVEKTTVGNVVGEIIIGLIICSVGVFFISTGIWVAGIPIFIIGLMAMFPLGNLDFTEWMKKNKETVKNIDDLIKNNPEFARRLYYEKCPKNHLLKYIEKLNPTVANEIKASKK